MDFSAALHCRLSSLDTALAQNTGSLRPRWFRRGRLAQRRRHRQALMKWRELRTCFQAAGVPSLPARLGVVDDPPAFFWCAETGSRVLLPADKRFVPALTGARPTSCDQAIVLLHEWGHALLYPQADHAWLSQLSGPAREHAHPAWAQVGEYAGWRVFNEMFADAFATSWMLRLFNYSDQVVDALRTLRDVRSMAAQHFNHIDFPCHHQTAHVIDQVMSERWGGDPGTVMRRLVSLSSDAFNHWYQFAPIPGKDVCASSRRHLAMLDQKFSAGGLVTSMLGHPWRPVSQPSTHRSRYLLESLRTENPNHFLLGLHTITDVPGYSLSTGPMSGSLPVSR